MQNFQFLNPASRHLCSHYRLYVFQLVWSCSRIGLVRFRTMDILEAFGYEVAHGRAGREEKTDTLLDICKMVLRAPDKIRETDYEGWEDATETCV